MATTEELLKKLGYLQDQLSSLEVSLAQQGASGSPRMDALDVTDLAAAIATAIQLPDPSHLLTEQRPSAAFETLAPETPVPETPVPETLEFKTLEFERLSDLLGQIQEAQEQVMAAAHTTLEAANLALQGQAEQGENGRLEALLNQLNHDLLSTAPEDGFESIAERLSSLTGQMDGLKDELKDQLKDQLDQAISLAEATPQPSAQLGDFTEFSPAVQTFGGAVQSEDRIEGRGQWNTGYITARLLKHPGEYVEFIPQGAGVFGLIAGGEPTQWQANHAALLVMPGQPEGQYAAISRESGLKAGLSFGPGQPVRLTIQDNNGILGIEWANVEGELIVPRFRFPISIPTAGLAPWALFSDGDSQVSSLKLGTFSNTGS